MRIAGHIDPTDRRPQRVWTRTQALENLEDYDKLSLVGGFELGMTVPLSELTEVLVAEGYKHFRLTEDDA